MPKTDNKLRRFQRGSKQHKKALEKVKRSIKEDSFSGKTILLTFSGKLGVKILNLRDSIIQLTGDSEITCGQVVNDMVELVHGLQFGKVSESNLIKKLFDVVKVATERERLNDSTLFYLLHGRAPMLEKMVHKEDPTPNHRGKKRLVCDGSGVPQGAGGEDSGLHQDGEAPPC